MARRCSAKFKFQVVMELLTDDKTTARVAKAYGVHPNTVNAWKKNFLEQGPEIFAQDNLVTEYERRIADLERLIDRKEVEIALSKTSWDGRIDVDAKGILGPEREGHIWLESRLVGRGPAEVDLAVSAETESELRREVRSPVARPGNHRSRAHPEYGVPRIMPELREEYDVGVNHKVVERLLGIWDLSIVRSTHRPRPSSVQQAMIEAGERANLVAQMEKIGLFQVLYTDFTELLYANGQRKAVLIPIIGHTSKMAFGWAIGKSADTALASQAWRQANETFRRLDIPHTGMILHHDRDSVFTSYEWTSQLLLKDSLRLSYVLWGAKDNPEMDSFNGRFKTEGHSLFLEAQGFAELIAVVDQRMRYHNTERRHSSIGYVPPLTFIRSTPSEQEGQVG